MTINIPAPDLQIAFAAALDQIRDRYLQQALSRTVGQLAVHVIDDQLATFANSQDQNKLAQRHLRGELLFAVPAVIQQNPLLLGYYRLLLGFSQKAFYATGTGLAPFKTMEDRGVIAVAQRRRLPELCGALCACASQLLQGIDQSKLTASLLDDLALLTVGPQLRGGHNVALGVAGTMDVFEIIKGVVSHSIKSADKRCIQITNAAKRKVRIEFAADPDIIIREEMAANSYRNVIAIEIKGGADFSNIHNRIGEAEKSHQKAKSIGYNECWTVVNVDKIDLAMAKRESPSTSRFYVLSQLKSRKSTEFTDFRNRLVSLIGIRSTRQIAIAKRSTAKQGARSKEP